MLLFYVVFFDRQLKIILFDQIQQSGHHGCGVMCVEGSLTCPFLREEQAVLRQGGKVEIKIASAVLLGYFLKIAGIGEGLYHFKKILLLAGKVNEFDDSHCWPSLCCNCETNIL